MSMTEENIKIAHDVARRLGLTNVVNYCGEVIASRHEDPHGGPHLSIEQSVDSLQAHLKFRIECSSPYVDDWGEAAIICVKVVEKPGGQTGEQRAHAFARQIAAAWNEAISQKVKEINTAGLWSQYV